MKTKIISINDTNACNVIKGFVVKPGFVTFSYENQMYITSGTSDEYDASLWAYHFNDKVQCWEGVWLPNMNKMLKKIWHLQGHFYKNTRFKKCAASTAQYQQDSLADTYFTTTVNDCGRWDEYIPTNVKGVFHTFTYRTHSPDYSQANPYLESEDFVVLTKEEAWELEFPEEAEIQREYEEACKKASSYSDEDLAVFDGEDNEYWKFVDVLPGEKSNNGGEYGFYSSYYPTERKGVYELYTSTTCDFDACGTGREGFVVLTKDDLARLIRGEEAVLERGCLY